MMTDTETMRKRKLRFAECGLPESNAKVSKIDTDDALKKRQMRFSKEEIKKPNEDLLNTLKRRKERFGEITSTLLKSIEEKEKVLKRKARFGQTNEEIKQNGDKVKNLKSEQKLENNTCKISSFEQINGKRILKKIIFNDNLSLSRKKVQLNES